MIMRPNRADLKYAKEAEAWKRIVEIVSTASRIILASIARCHPVVSTTG